MIQPIKILYVDDSTLDRELVIDSLEKEHGGFQVTQASSREEFESCLLKEKYDLVLSDFNILGYEGLLILDTVNNFDPSIPVIIVTGTGSEEIAVKAMKQGAADYVIKSPSHIRHLPLMIKAVMEKKHLKKQHKKAQEELVRLRKAVENSGEIIFMTDREGIFTFINPEFTKIYGYLPEEILYKYTPAILKSKGSPKGYFKPFWDQLLGGNIVKGEIVNATKADINLNIEFTLSPVYDENKKISSFLAIQRDVTVRKYSEEVLRQQYIELEKAKNEAEKADRIKTEFLAQMSHEIRTPINTILNYTSLVKGDVQDYLEEDTRYSFEAIERASHRLIRTIDLILNMSEIQTESYQPYFREIDIQNTINHLLADFSIPAKRKGIKIKFKCDCKECKITGDEYTINQIFQNLIDNAIKYTSKGYVEVCVYKQDKALYVEIIDSGIGISQEFLPKLFTPFTQETMGYTRPYDGNGLGLAIVKKYIEINQGDIDIQSEKGKGTKVTVKFAKSLL